MNASPPRLRAASQTLLAHKSISLADELSAIEKRVAAALLDHFNRQTSQCDPSLGTLAYLLGVSERTIIRAVNSLDHKGFIRRAKHGGKFHRNSYQIDWPKFAALSERWAEKRKSRRAPTPMSLSPRHPCQCADDSAVTQTFIRNQSHSTCAPSHALSTSTLPAPQQGSEWLGKGAKDRAASLSNVEQRFHVKAGSWTGIARDAAERRWTNALTEKFQQQPALHGAIIDAITPELSEATTAAELRQKGSGLAYLTRELSALLASLQTCARES